MKSRFTTIIMYIIILLIISVFGLFIIAFWNEFKPFEVASYEPENFQTVIEDTESEIEKEVKTPAIIENVLDKIKNGNTQDVDYSNVNVDKFFYNQLDNYSQLIYKAFESNKENMKTGTYKVELENSFSDLLNLENGQEELTKYYQSAIEAYTYDNPDVFYLNPNKMYLNIETTQRGFSKSYYLYINSGEMDNYLIDEFNSKEEVDVALQKVEQIRNVFIQRKTGNRASDIKMVHDYLIENVSYDVSVSKQNIYNICGALLNGEAVCEGYARAFKYIMDGLDIPCTLVFGKGINSKGETENHAWNYVEINGQWYAIDVTWDDPVISGGGTLSRESKYKYFLKGTDEFNSDHSPSGQFTDNGKMFNYPQISSQNY